MSEKQDDASHVAPVARQGWLHNIRHYFAPNLTGTLLFEIELLTVSFATGIMDATLFADYHVFASNQTGNTVFLAIGALGIARDFVNLRDTAISLGLFAAGGIVLGQLGNYSGKRTRGWLVATNVFQTLLILASAAIRQWGPHADDNSTYWPLGVIAPLAFASAGQVAVARAVNVSEITTVVVTSAYVDLFVDEHLLAPPTKNRSRNRRALFIIFLLLGAFVGAAARRYVGGAFALLLTAICKLLATIGFFFNPAVRQPTT